MKKTILCLLLAAVFLGCSKEGRGPIKLEEIKLELSKDVIYPFEEIIATINITDHAQMKLHYDSIVWHVPATVISTFEAPALIPISTGDLVAYKIPVTDVSFGAHDIFVEGYKDGEVISSDKKSYTVNGNGARDFFPVEWGVFTYLDNSFHHSTTGILPFIYKGIADEIYHFKKEGNEFAKLEYSYWTFQHNGEPENVEFSDEERESIRADYYELYPRILTDTYGKSVSKHDGEDIWNSELVEEYQNKFSYDLGWSEIYETNLYFPIEIWETSNSNIALLGSVGIKRGVKSKLYGHQLVIAEPKTNNTQNKISLNNISEKPVSNEINSFYKVSYSQRR